jgi:hypothetical protein
MCRTLEQTLTVGTMRHTQACPHCTLCCDAPCNFRVCFLTAVTCILQTNLNSTLYSPCSLHCLRSCVLIVHNMDSCYKVLAIVPSRAGFTLPVLLATANTTKYDVDGCIRGQEPNSSAPSCQHSVMSAWKGKTVSGPSEESTTVAPVTTTMPVDTGLTLDATVSLPFLGSNMNS